MIRILGIGNTLMGDDGAGVAALEEIKKELKKKRALSEEVEAIDAGTGGIDILNYIRGIDEVILIDAVKTGCGHPPGTVFRLTQEDLSDEDFRSISLHDISIEQVLQIGREILGDEYPGAVKIFGIEAGAIGQGPGLSRDVERAIPKVVDLVLKEIGTGG